MHYANRLADAFDIFQAMTMRLFLVHHSMAVVRRTPLAFLKGGYVTVNLFVKFPQN